MATTLMATATSSWVPTTNTTDVVVAIFLRLNVFFLMGDFEEQNSATKITILVLHKKAFGAIEHRVQQLHQKQNTQSPQCYTHEQQIPLGIEQSEYAFKRMPHRAQRESPRTYSSGIFQPFWMADNLSTACALVCRHTYSVSIILNC